MSAPSRHPRQSPVRAAASKQLKCGMCFVMLLAFGTVSSSCDDRTIDSAESARVSLHVWGHSGRESERLTLQSQVDRFNNSRSGVFVELTLLPEGSYNSQVQAAALAGELPDVLEFDGPFLYNYVWQGHLVPLDNLVSGKTRESLLPSIIRQGTYAGHLWSLGMYDSGLSLFANRRKLLAANARIPSGVEDGWSAEEFCSVLAGLAAIDADGAVLDLKLNYAGEWYTYAFSPAIQSAGGDLIDRTDYRSARGQLDCPAAINAMTYLQNWIRRDRYVDPNLDDNAFVSGRVAISWVGHWEYKRYKEALGDDLLLLPLPDFGRGTRTGQGSWNWGITSRCRNEKLAADFLEFLMKDRQVLEMARANDAVPGTLSAIRLSALHKSGGPLQMYVTQLSEGQAVPRPQSPAYPVITALFQQAFDDIRHGADVRKVLHSMAIEVDQDIEDNRGYPYERGGE